MKKLIITAKMVLLLIIAQGCTNEWTDPISECRWENKEIVQFYQLELLHPANISNYHKNLIPLDRIERALDNILYTNGDAPNNGSFASIDVNLYSDGTSCTGSSHRKYTRSNGADQVSATTIYDVPFPSNAAFIGEISVTIKTDVYNNTSGSQAYYHVRWKETGNDPNGGIVGQMIGLKIPHGNVNGVQSIFVGPDNAYIFRGGNKDFI